MSEDTFLFWVAGVASWESPGLARPAPFFGGFRVEGLGFRV